MGRFEHSSATASDVRERRCIVTGETLPCGQMVRFVSDPDGRVTPDLETKLPGRGMWVRARHDLIARAAPAFIRSHGSAVHADADIADRVEALLRQKITNICGLVRKAGKIVLGFTKVLAALERGQACLVMHASDGAEGGREKIDRLAGKLGVPVRAVLNSATLSGVLGRENVIHVAITDAQWADRLIAECDRIMGYRPSE